LQENEHQIETLQSESDELKGSLKDAETRLSEFYTDQARMEDDLAAHHAIAEKLREQLKEVEKEKRDLNRRYNEQVSLHLLVLFNLC
jgi:chromosome segregation ATPase